MQLVYIYGALGVGKFTVAQELVALTGFKLFHNHLAVNLAASIFSHQSEPYFRLIRRSGATHSLKPFNKTWT